MVYSVHETIKATNSQATLKSKFNVTGKSEAESWTMYQII